MRPEQKSSVTRIIPLVFLLFSAASCSSATNGFPEVSVPSGLSTAQTSSVPRYSVDDPLNVAPFLERPCELVSPDVLVSLGFDPAGGRARTSGNDEVAALAGPYCGWSGEKEGNLTVSVQSGNTERGVGGLEGIRTLHDQGRFKLWEETNMVGYPAAYYAMQDMRAQGECAIAVGVAEDMSITVGADFFVDDPSQACSTAENVAANVIETLKAEG
ncbi:DUF3558 domain-containing protein [Saccharomonospora cyanea]|uniref:DUF3558 domain-containing protein n=1 Tax=Saccharomonospora cyanea TaxID=40989 RepID=UPI0012F948E8|nr:DUF3558 domain-containing protein [Saccharomonospora cyanea]